MKSKIVTFILAYTLITANVFSENKEKTLLDMFKGKPGITTIQIPKIAFDFLAIIAKFNKKDSLKVGGKINIASEFIESFNALQVFTTTKKEVSQNIKTKIEEFIEKENFINFTSITKENEEVNIYMKQKDEIIINHILVTVSEQDNNSEKKEYTIVSLEAIIQISNIADLISR